MATLVCSGMLRGSHSITLSMLASSPVLVASYCLLQVRT